jgi:hypothetical protein
LPDWVHFAFLQLSDNTMEILDLVTILAVLAAGFLVLQALNGSTHSLPPGPKPYPILGNILDMPKKESHLSWESMGKEYGPLTYLKILNRSVLVLNSHEAAKDLLEKRGKIYSDRPHSVMFSELVGKMYPGSC